MKTRIAINGFGRIGRLVLRALIESGRKDIEVVAINDLSSLETNAYLLKYDSAQGTFSADIESGKDYLSINKNKIRVFAEKDPSVLPWKKLKIDVVAECTGVFRSKDTASMHLKAGAKRVLISSPGKEIDLTVVHGVNHTEISKSHQILSNGSCTTNCIAPILKVLNDEIGIRKGHLTTIHAYTSSQKLVDVADPKDMRRSRAAAISMIPTSTGAAKAVCEVIPELEGKISGSAIRVPTITGSVVDLTCILDRNTTTEEINQLFQKKSKTKPFKGVIEYTTLPLVSHDIIHNPHSAIVDGQETIITDGNFARLIIWYDNEWGFSNRMLDTIREISKKI